MSTERLPDPRRSLRELVVSSARGDFLELEPLELGPGAPATAALTVERGPEPPTGRPEAA